MPHIDFATFASQILWLLLTFVAIYFIVAKRYVPSVAGVVIGRNRDIKQMVADSEGLDAEVKLLQRELSDIKNEVRLKVSLKKSDARKKAEAILGEAARKSQVEVLSLRAEQEESLRALRRELSDEIAGIADQITKDVNAKIYNLYKFNITKMNDVV